MEFSKLLSNNRKKKKRKEVGRGRRKRIQNLTNREVLLTVETKN
jgi:hypothetical protein